VHFLSGHLVTIVLGTLGDEEPSYHAEYSTGDTSCTPCDQRAFMRAPSERDSWRCPAMFYPVSALGFAAGAGW